MPRAHAAHAPHPGQPRVPARGAQRTSEVRSHAPLAAAAYPQRGGPGIATTSRSTANVRAEPAWRRRARSARAAARTLLRTHSASHAARHHSPSIPRRAQSQPSTGPPRRSSCTRSSLDALRGAKPSQGRSRPTRLSSHTARSTYAFFRVGRPLQQGDRWPASSASLVASPCTLEARAGGARRARARQVTVRPPSGIQPPRNGNRRSMLGAAGANNQVQCTWRDKRSCSIASAQGSK